MAVAPYLYLLTGGALIVLALGGYSSDLGRVREALVSTWIFVGVTSERAEGRHARWIRTFSRKALEMMEWLFGPRLLSFRGFWVGLMLSRASALFWLARSMGCEVLVHQGYLADDLPDGIAEDAWRRYETMYGHGVGPVVAAIGTYATVGVSYTLASALPAALRDLRLGSIGRTTSTTVVVAGSLLSFNWMSQEFASAADYARRGLWYPPFTMLVTPMLGVPMNLLVASVVRWAARHGLRARLGAATRWFVGGAVAVAVPVYLYGRFARWVWHQRPPGDAIAMVLVTAENSPDGALSAASVFLAFGFVLVVHRVMWGALARPVYTLHNLTLSRVALGCVGAGLLAAYDSHVGELARKVVFSALGLRIPIGQ